MSEPRSERSDRGQSDADQIITVDLLHSVILSGERSLRGIEAATRVRKWQTVVVALFGVLLLFIASQNYINSQQIKSCVPPPPGSTPGECYKSSQEATAGVVAQLGVQNAAVLTAYRACLRINPNLTDAQLQACVVGRLQPAAPPRPGATPAPRPQGKPAPPRDNMAPPAAPGRPAPPQGPPAGPPAPPPPPQQPPPAPPAPPEGEPLLCVPILDLCI